MDKVSNLVSLVFKNLGMTNKYHEAVILFHWAEIVGKEVYLHSRPNAVERGILILSVSNSSWSHHLMMLKQQIIDKINGYFEKTIIKDIRFVAGYYRSETNENNAESKVESDKAINLNNIKLNENDNNTVNELTGIIHDPKLKMVAFRIVKKYIASHKHKISKNYRECKICKRLCLPEEDYCSMCQVQQKILTKQKIRQILREVPWISYQECNKYIACTPYVFDEAKYELLASLESEIIKDNNSINIHCFVMLKTGLKPDQITNDIIEKALQTGRRKRHVFTHRR